MEFESNVQFTLEDRADVVGDVAASAGGEGGEVLESGSKRQEDVDEGKDSFVVAESPLVKLSL